MLDLEAVQRWEWNRMLLMGSLGVRYMRMDQDLLATAITAVLRKFRRKNSKTTIASGH